MHVVNRWILPINSKFHCIRCMLYRVIDYIESIRRILFMSLSTSVIYCLVDNDFTLILVYTIKNKCFLLLFTWAIFRYDLFKLCTLSFKRRAIRRFNLSILWGLICNRISLWINCYGQFNLLVSSKLLQVMKIHALRISCQHIFTFHVFVCM